MNQNRELLLHEKKTPQDRWFPEGYLIPILSLALVGLSAWAVEQADWPDMIMPVLPIALLGAAFGWLLARLRASEPIVQLSSLLVGLIVVIGFAVLRAEELGADLRTRSSALVDVLGQWFTGQQTVDDFRYLPVSILLALIVWLIAFFSCWALFRRGMVMLAILLTGFLTLLQVLFSTSVPAWLPAVFAALAIALALRYALYTRQSRWARLQIATPVGLSATFTRAGLILAAVVAAVGFTAPPAWSETVLDPLVSEVGEMYSRVSNRSEAWFDELLSNVRPTSTTVPESYSDFQSAFAIGDAPNLTDEPEVLVRTDTITAPYLTAHTYDEYTGRGWESSTDRAFEDQDVGGVRVSPELLFGGNQQIVLSGDVRSDRAVIDAEVVPLTSRSNVMLTVNSHLSADVQTVVRMSWLEVDAEPYVITSDTLTALPPDIQRLSNLLLQAELSGQQTAWGPAAVSPSMQEQIDLEVDDLARRGLEVQWIATPDGLVESVLVTGRLPVFDDVEVVYARTPGEVTVGSSYSIEALTSSATDGELRASAPDYPKWVTDRYLQTGDTVTDRTVALANELTQGLTTPYDRAKAIETYLRSSIEYDLTVSAPPDDADLVDWTLFEMQRGYCEHYSAAMTVMLRSVGIPAREVVGYYPGELDNAQGGFLYRNWNAHAWTEVYFPGYGWIAFEPTSNRPSDEHLLEQSAGAALPTPTAEPTVVIPTPDLSDENTQSTPVPATPVFEEAGPPEFVPDVPSDESGVPGWVVPVALGALAISVMAALAIGAWMWRLRTLSPSAAMMERARRIGRWQGVPERRSMTPREYGHAFGRRIPTLQKPMRRITRAYEVDRFRDQQADDGLIGGAKSAWGEIRSAAPRLAIRRRFRRKT